MICSCCFPLGFILVSCFVLILQPSITHFLSLSNVAVASVGNVVALKTLPDKKVIEKYNNMIKLNEEFGHKINEHIEQLQIYNNKQQVDNFDYLSRLNRYYMDINVCITNMMTLLNMYSFVTENYIETERIIVNEITRNIVTMDNIEKALKLLFKFTIESKCQEQYICEEYRKLLFHLPWIIEQQKELQRHFQQRLCNPALSR